MSELAWNVGEVRVTRVAERQGTLPIGQLLPEASLEAVEAHAAWLRPHFLAEAGSVELSIHALVAESGALTVVVDTCAGDRPMPGFDAAGAGAVGFLERFEASGFDVESIDFVLCTHMHFDHVGWNTRREGDRWIPTFPNAKYLFARTEWEHWRRDEGSAYAGDLGVSIEPVIAAGQAEFVDTDHVIDERLRLVPTPGHTPGHVSLAIESEGERGFITGDMTHHPVQWAEPDWMMVADVDATEAAATRKRVGGELARSGALVIGTHYPAPTAGWVSAAPDGLRFTTERPQDR